MITLRRSEDRGRTKMEWLDSRHSFSFGHYHDPQHMGFRALRVINEDWIAPLMGFGLHPHRDMEIVTVVLEGALEHKDSMRNRGVIGRGEIQRMTAGTGIMHSEFNPSPEDTVHLMQIWMLPERNGLEPGYEQRDLDWSQTRNGLRMIASPNEDNGAVMIHTNVDMLVGSLGAGESLDYRPTRGHAWMQVIKGKLALNGIVTQAGDGVAVTQEDRIDLQASEAGEFLLFDLG